MLLIDCKLRKFDLFSKRKKYDRGNSFPADYDETEFRLVHIQNKICHNDYIKFQFCKNNKSNCQSDYWKRDPNSSICNTTSIIIHGDILDSLQLERNSSIDEIPPNRSLVEGLGGPVVVLNHSTIGIRQGAQHCQLSFGDGDGISKDGPDDHLIAGGGGEAPLVAVEPRGVSREERRDGYVRCLVRGSAGS